MYFLKNARLVSIAAMLVLGLWTCGLQAQQPAPSTDQPAAKALPAPKPETTKDAGKDAAKDAAKDDANDPAKVLTPQQREKIAAMEMRMAAIRAQQAEMSLAMSKMQLEKTALDLALAKRGMMEMTAQDDVNGVFMYFEPVTQESVKKAVIELTKLSRRMTQIGPKGEVQRLPINIILNSPGGDVMAGLALYDHIRSLSKSGHKVTVTVRGMAASMGGILLQAGDERVIGENAEMLIHEVSGGAGGKTSDIKEELAHRERLEKRLLTILAKRSKMTVKDIDEKFHKTDWWLTAEEAVKLGFADRVE